MNPPLQSNAEHRKILMPTGKTQSLILRHLLSMSYEVASGEGAWDAGSVRYSAVHMELAVKRI